MACFIQQSVLSTQKRSRNQMLLTRTALVTSAIISMLSISACQSVPVHAPTSMTTKPTSTSVSQMPVINDDNSINDGSANDHPIEPYVPPKQSTAPDTVVEQASVQYPRPTTTIPSRDDAKIQLPTPPSRNELLERARQNSQQRSRPSTVNNSNLPAFKNLMQTGIKQLKSGNLTAAESSFTRAQRLAPKSVEPYFYLSQVALKKNQPRKAEAMARRGLSVSTDANHHHSLWQIILRSGQMQNNPRVIKEAQQALR
ncbi:tetratricopeptide repeat protein [Psychrobacter frigidicola]|uniref:Tetratricopeptide repeat protein n=2 Tax=Psychrobacter frigidicola TaxID=45611 RepID=A0A5C7A666_9GAMM|nr:tetratricopeptide repeat protein [Psychrobacter frigidicola]